MEHILHTVFNLPGDSPLEVALKEAYIDTVDALLAPSRHEIDALTVTTVYKNKKIKGQELPLGLCNLILVFKGYNKHLWIRGESPDWKDMTYADFSEYRLHTYDPEM